MQGRLARARHAVEMRVQIATLVAVVASAFLVGVASATESTIYPGAGIGKVRLGMTLTQVKKALGPPQTVNKRAQIRGHQYTEYGWNFSTLWVGFLNTKGVLHTVLVGTGLRSQKTPHGDGVGTRIETLQNREHVTCNTGPNADPQYRFDAFTDPTMTIYGWCVLGPPTMPTTIFRMDCASHGPICGQLTVGGVIVRKPV
jgi:hypothetical protein